MNRRYWVWSWVFAGFVVAGFVVAGFVLAGCRTSGGGSKVDEPRSVQLRVCGRGECAPCEDGGRGIEVKTEISRRRPVECAWDSRSRTCTNEGSRLAFALETDNQGRRFLELGEKDGSHSPGAWKVGRQSIRPGATVVTDRAANLNFRKDRTTDWDYDVRVLDSNDKVVACTDPRIFIHQIPPGR